ncbi:hypothetical protein SODG_007203 [Sodalis praecaptivus]
MLANLGRKTVLNLLRETSIKAWTPRVLKKNIRKAFMSALKSEH